MGFFTQFKDFLKRFLPPPINTFNREMGHISEILIQQQKLIVFQQKQIDEQQSRLREISEKLSKTELWIKRTTPQPRLSYFEFGIVDHCNLRCKGCGRFSCIAEERFVSVEDIRKDLNRLSELLHGAVTRIGVMGGEPLLHPDLEEILIATRIAFPNTYIQLITNGLLLLKMSDDFWKCCRENNIIVAITKYPINLEYEEIQKVATKYNTRFEFFGGTDRVQKTLSKFPLDIKGCQNPIYSWRDCLHTECVSLENGKLYTCPIACTARIFNKKYNTNLQLEAEDYLDLYEVQSADEIYRFLSKPKPFCRYCMISKREFGLPWGQTEQKMSEWLPG